MGQTREQREGEKEARNSSKGREGVLQDLAQEDTGKEKTEKANATR
jgi:hypothetical protein